MIALQEAQKSWEGAVAEPCTDTLGPSHSGQHESEALHHIVTSAGRFQMRVVEWQPGTSASPAHGSAEEHSRSLLQTQAAVQGDSASRSARPPVVVMLHGFLGAPTDWRAVASALSLGCRCLAVELLGHGHSCTVDTQGELQK